MKKIIPVLAVLGSAVAFAVYKMKKDEQKELIELDEGLLEDEEEPQFKKAEPQPDPMPAFTSMSEMPKEVEPAFATTTSSEPDEIKAMFEGLVEEEPTIPFVNTPTMEEVAPTLEPVVANHDDEMFSSEYPNLTNRIVQDINTMTKDAIATLANDGDVHEHERPVQHMVSFAAKEDLEDFKSRVINKGFVITKGEGEYDLVVLHISPIDEEKLVTNVLYLADQAYANHGEYNGWQSKVSF